MGTAGVAAGNECWCSNLAGSQGPETAADGCKQNCVGDGNPCGYYCKITQFTFTCGRVPGKCYVSRVTCTSTALAQFLHHNSHAPRPTPRRRPLLLASVSGRRVLRVKGVARRTSVSSRTHYPDHNTRAIYVGTVRICNLQAKEAWQAGQLRP